jgi:hypothetical protein
LVKKIEDLNEFWAVLKTQNRFMQGIECTPPPSWTLRTIDAWIKAGYFWTVTLRETKREFPVK